MKANLLFHFVKRSGINKSVGVNRSSFHVGIADDVALFVALAEEWCL